jgi:hypothetical protein
MADPDIRSEAVAAVDQAIGARSNERNIHASINGVGVGHGSGDLA